MTLSLNKKKKIVSLQKSIRRGFPRSRKDWEGAYNGVFQSRRSPHDAGNLITKNSSEYKNGAGGIHSGSGWRPREQSSDSNGQSSSPDPASMSDGSQRTVLTSTLTLASGQ